MDFFLTSKSLVHIKEAGIKDDFKLTILDEVIYCSKFTAAFLSPKITRIINTDYTIDQYNISFPDKSEFYSSTDELKNMFKHTNFVKQIQDLIDGKPIHINQSITSEIKLRSESIFSQDGNHDSDTAKLLVIFGQILDNEEMIKGGLKYLGIDECMGEITSENVFDIIQFSRFGECDHKFQQLFDYIASNFFSLFKKENVENRQKLKKLSNYELEQILKSPKLRIEDENSLFEIILSLGSNFYELFDYVELQYLSIQNIQKFIQLINNDDLSLHPLLWSSICRRLILDCSNCSDLINPRQKCLIIPCENGIIDYLNKKLESNVYLAQGITVETSKRDCGKIESLFDGSLDTHFRITNRKDSFILFDFDDKKIKFSKYYLSVPSEKSTAYTGRPKTWRIEGSNDKKNWDLIDLRQDDTNLATWSCSKKFECQNCTNQYYRYIRINGIVSHNNTHEFLLSGIEFYGRLMEL